MPVIWLCGPAARDHVAAEVRAGGAVTFAALAASALGQRAHVLAAAESDAHLGPLEGHEVRRVDTGPTLAYRIEPAADEGRRLRLLQPPGRALGPADVPAEWPAPDVLVLGPLAPGDMDVAGLLAAAPRARHVALIAQGLQRRIEAGAVHVEPHPAPALLEALERGARGQVSVFLSAEEVAPWSPEDVAAVLARAARLVVTRGAQGATVRTAAGSLEIPPTPARAVVDSTGAGDVFAAAFILAVADGADDAAAGRLAGACAAASLARAGPQPLPPRSELEALMRAGDGEPQRSRDRGTHVRIERA